MRTGHSRSSSRSRRPERRGAAVRRVRLRTRPAPSPANAHLLPGRAGERRRPILSALPEDERATLVAVADGDALRFDVHLRARRDRVLRTLTTELTTSELELGWRPTQGEADRARRDVRRLAPARADADLRESGLDRDPVPDRAARRPRFVLGAARRLGDRAGERLRDRPRRAGARAAAHDRRARQRRRRDRDRARQPGAASSSSSASRTAGTSPTSRSSPAGSTASRASTRWRRAARAPAGRPGRDRACTHAARPPRAGARDRADGRLGGARRRGRASPPPPRARAARAGRRSPRRSTRSRRSSQTRSAPALVVGAGADDPATWRRSSSSPSGSSRPCSRSRSGRAPASRRTTRSSPGVLSADRPGSRAARALRRGARRRRAGLPPGGVRARPVHRARARGSPSSATTRTRRTAAPPS